MRELIESGHLYIAQPPLYKVTRGKSEVYLKDEFALQDYLIHMGMEGATLKLSDGSQIAGKDLSRIVSEAKKVMAILKSFPARYSKFVLEQAALSGVLVDGLFKSKPENVIEKLTNRLNYSAEEFEKGWHGTINDNGGLRLTRLVRGVEEVRDIDSSVLNSSEARNLGKMFESLNEIYETPATLIWKTKERSVKSPSELFSEIVLEGEKGLTLQRYKGLGEMNPDQLWETTLDPEARTLLRVKIDRYSNAHEIFDKLMGDVVEPRRNFIQENALTVANLDY
jgi:DNA gyrase subunit B